MQGIKRFGKIDHLPGVNVMKRFVTSRRSQWEDFVFEFASLDGGKAFCALKSQHQILTVSFLCCL